MEICKVFFYNFNSSERCCDLKSFGAKYNKKSNNIPKICLGFLTPNEVLEKYLGVMYAK